MALGDFTNINYKSDKERIDDLERRIRELEEKAAKQTSWWHPDVWPKDKNPWPDPYEPSWPTFEESKCPVCGNEYKNMTYYVCNHDKCPSRVTYISNG